MTMRTERRQLTERRGGGSAAASRGTVLRDLPSRRSTGRRSFTNYASSAPAHRSCPTAAGFAGPRTKGFHRRRRFFDLRGCAGRSTNHDDGRERMCMIAMTCRLRADNNGARRQRNGGEAVIGSGRPRAAVRASAAAAMKRSPSPRQVRCLAALVNELVIRAERRTRSTPSSDATPPQFRSCESEPARL